VIAGAPAPQKLDFHFADFVVHTVLPLVFAVVLLGLVQHGQHNAATWSSISNQLQGTLWPFLLRGDGSAAQNVRWRVQFMSTVAIFGTLCLLLAGFLTPKPLIEQIRASHKIHSVQFVHAPGNMPCDPNCFSCLISAVQTPPSTGKVPQQGLTILYVVFAAEKNLRTARIQSIRTLQ